jgi:cell division protein FtsB
MTTGNTLFDDGHAHRGTPDNPEKIFYDSEKETILLERFKNLEEKIAAVVERVKALKEEKNLLEKRIHELENLLNEKDQIIESLKAEKMSFKTQVEDLLSDLETIEL